MSQYVTIIHHACILIKYDFVVIKCMFSVIFGAQKFWGPPLEISEHAIAMHLFSVHSN